MIRFEMVSKRFGPKTILDAIDLEIKEGETFVILGASGMGKSVTLKHMVRLLTPDSGKVWVGDDVVSDATGSDLERIRSRFGYLFQGGALMQWMDISNNVGLALRERTAMQDEDIDALVDEKLALVNLEGVGTKQPSELSGGMRKRAALARAIITNPEIILYDEPTSGLDPVTSRKIDDLIDNLRKELGVTSIVVTHDLHSALRIATRIAVLHHGKIVELSPPEKFVKSQNEVVKSFLDAQYITKEGPWEDDVNGVNT